MKTRFLLAVISLAVLLPLVTQAASKKKEQKQMDKAVSGRSAAPSERLEAFLEPCLNAVLSPLEGSPKMPRVEVEKLRASFAAEHIKATTQGRQQICQNAMAVCDSLTKSMDDRAKAKAAVEASLTTPLRSNASSIIKSSPMKGRDAGANAEAVRKKQKDERKDADNAAAREAAHMNSTAYRSWTDGAPALRRSVMALFTRQVQLEALEERNATIAAQAAQAAKSAEAAKAAQAAKAEAVAKVAAAEKAAKTAAEEKAAEARAEAMARVAAAEKAAKVAQEEAVAKAADAEEVESAKQASMKNLDEEKAYVGTWVGQGGKKTITVKEDHTASRKIGDEETNGAWNIVDGEFRLHWEEGNGIRGKLSEDGQRIEARGQQFTRKKS